MKMMNFRMEELLPIVAWLSEKYTSKESTSISYEKARQLMEAVLYCIHQCEDNNQLMSKGEMDAKKIYQAGYQRVIQKVQNTQIVYSEMIEQFDAYGNENYYDTVIKALPGFFRYYDARFAPQETIITMDYPTICPVTDSSGIDAIEKYVQYISFEQQFMGALPQEYIQEVLFRYQAGYKKQFYNICNIIFRHILGNMMIGKSLGQLSTEEDYEMLQEIILQHESEWIEDAFSKLLKRLIEEKYSGDSLLESYLKADLQNFMTEIRVAAKNNCVQRVVAL